jgi:DNA-binding PadR family transcriptional regulator
VATLSALAGFGYMKGTFTGMSPLLSAGRTTIIGGLAAGAAYGIAKAIRGNSSEALDIEFGSLYPALKRLELKGWIAGKWETSEHNRRVKHYHLTPAGRKQLRREHSHPNMWLLEKRRTATSKRIQRMQRTIGSGRCITRRFPLLEERHRDEGGGASLGDRHPNRRLILPRDGLPLRATHGLRAVGFYAGSRATLSPRPAAPNVGRIRQSSGTSCGHRPLKRRREKQHVGGHYASADVVNSTRLRQKIVMTSKRRQGLNCFGIVP